MLITDVVSGKYMEEAQPMKLQPAKNQILPTKSYNLHKRKKSILAAQAVDFRGD